MNETTQNNQIDKSVVNLMRAIKTHESGNDYKRRGADNEYGAYQYLPSTFKDYASRYAQNPNARIEDPVDQDKVTYATIKTWKDKGYTPEQVMSMWNAGEGRPDAYKEGLKGTSRGGVEYDVGKYVESVKNILNQQLGNIEKKSEQDIIQKDRETRIESGQPVSINEGKSEPTMGGEIIRDITKPFARLGVNMRNVANLVAGKEPTESVSSKYYGDLTPVGAGFDVAKPLSENKKALKDIVGTGLEVGSYLGGGSATKAGAKSVLAGKSFGKSVGKQALKGAFTGGRVGLLAGTGEALQEDKSLGQSLLSGLKGMGVGALTGGALGAIGGMLSKSAGFTPESEKIVKEKAKQDFAQVLQGSSWGIKAEDKPRIIKGFTDAVDEGFIPTLSKDGKRFNVNILTNQLDDSIIKPLQVEKGKILDTVPGQASIQDVKQAVIDEATKQYSKDTKTLIKVLRGIDDYFVDLEKPYQKGVTMRDLFNFQNSSEVAKYSKWERAEDAITQDKGKVARQIYFGIRNLLHGADNRVDEIDAVLTKYHGISDFLNAINGKSVPRGSVSILGNLFGSQLGRGAGTIVGGAVGNVPGALAGGQIESGIVSATTKKPFSSKVLKKGSIELQKKGKQKVEELLQKAKIQPGIPDIQF